MAKRLDGARKKEKFLGVWIPCSLVVPRSVFVRRMADWFMVCFISGSFHSRPMDLDRAIHGFGRAEAV